jgi:hypothetical protein
VLGFSRQAVCAWRQNPVSQRDWDDAHLISAAAALHQDDPGFGYQFIAGELPATGITAGGEPGRTAVLPAADLAGVGEETRAGPHGRAAGA